VAAPQLVEGCTDLEISTMKIIAGKFRGRKLRIPKGADMRPTSGIVRESLFGILGDWIENKDVLDLFAGCGGVGFEALSRGARSVTFIERCLDARTAIHQNAANLGVEESVTVVNGNASGKIRPRIDPEDTFDLVYIDPPYELRQPEKILGRIMSDQLLAAGGYIVFEQPREHAMVRSTKQLTCIDVRRYGRTVLSFFTEREQEGVGEGQQA